LRLSSFGGYGLALAALALVVFGAYDSYPDFLTSLWSKQPRILGFRQTPFASLVCYGMSFGRL